MRLPTVYCPLSTVRCLVVALAAVFSAALAAEAPPLDGDGGLAGLSSDDVAALREARQALERLVADAAQHETLRRDAAIGLNRIHEALNDWGKEGQLAWYFGQLSQNLPGPFQAVLVLGAQSAAKARQPHFGGVREFWRTLDALARQKGVAISAEAERVRKQFEAAADHLSGQSWISSPLRPFEVKIPPLDLRDLKPFPEPKR